MRRAAVALAVAVLLAATPAAGGGGVRRQAILLVTPGLAYDDALRDPLLRELSRAGGIGLMTTAGDDGPATGALTLGAGRAAAAAPGRPLAFDQRGDGLVVESGAFAAAARPATAGLLGSALAEAGETVAYVDLRGAGADPAMLVAMDAAGRIPLAALNRFPTLGALPPEFFGDAVPDVADADLIVTPQPEAVRLLVERSPADEVLVMAAGTAATREMRAEGDTLLAAVLARGTPIEVLDPTGPARGLTSGTTRRDGLVSNVDVAPTVLTFLGVPVPAEMAGSPIRAAGDPPTALHARSVLWRSVVTPVGAAVLAFAIVALATGAVLLTARRPPPAFGRAVAAAALGSVSLLVMLVPAAVLPTLALPVVLAAVFGGAAALTWAALALDRGGGRRAVAIVALAGLAAVVVDGLSGWPTGVTPFLGGSVLDGERFFGLGNPYAGIVLGGSVLVAARLRPAAGTALLAGAALFAGLPFAGADLGGGLTLALAAGLWAGAARWGAGWRAAALAGAAAAIAVAVFLVSHQVLPPGATHVSRAVESAGGVVGAVEVWWRRLLLNVGSTTATPAVWLAVLGVPVWLAVILRRPAALRQTLADERWRRAAIVLAVAGIAGYLLNDTHGTTSVAFVFLTAAIVFPALWVRARTPATASPDG